MNTLRKIFTNAPSRIVPRQRSRRREEADGTCDRKGPPPHVGGYRLSRFPARRGISGLIAGLLAVTVSLFAADAWKLPPETVKLKPGPGVELATGQCLLCHSADYIGTQPRLTRAGWEASVKKMKEKYGAPIPPDKIAALVDYLVANYGKENPAPALK